MKSLLATSLLLLLTARASALRAGAPPLLPDSAQSACLISTPWIVASVSYRE